jgi:hypothetical protein
MNQNKRFIPHPSAFILRHARRRMTQHIGIVAGSAEGAALCYRTICLEAPAMMG